MATKKKKQTEIAPKNVTESKEIMQALEDLHKSAWKQQRKKINSQKYKEQFVSEVSGTSNAGN